MILRPALLGVVPGLLLAQAPPIRVSPNLRMIPGPNNETWVAVSPVNPDVLLATAQRGDGSTLGWANTTVISRDGGRTWAPVTFPGMAPTPFDPMVAAGPDGRLYMLTGVIGGSFAANFIKDAPSKSHMRLWSSGDDGFTWDGPTELMTSVDPDHMRLVIDQSTGPTRGRIYLAWNDVADQFVRDQYEVFLQWSDDHGKTFTEPKLIAAMPGGKLVATEPVVLSDGTVLVTWYQYFFPLPGRANERMPMFVSRSADRGRTFSAPEKIFEFGNHTWRGAATEFGRAFSLPIVTADTSSASPHRDRIYVTWDEVSGGTSNIWLVRSTDRGRTWSKPIKVNDNGPAPATGIKDYRMTPVVAVAPTGTIMVAWYDRRNDPNRMCWEYYGATSADGGITFGPNFPVSTAPSCPPPGYPPGAWVHNLSPRLPNPNLLPDSVLERRSNVERLMASAERENQVARDELARGFTTGRLTLTFDPARNLWPGHYTGLAADRRGVFHAVWLDRRGGTQDLYTARVTIGGADAGLADGEQELSKQIEVSAGTPAFDPAKNTVTVPLQLRNVGSSVVGGPIRLAIKGTGAVAAFDTTVTFTGKLGTADRLEPRDLSEPVSVTFSVKPEAGFDAAFDFRVFGRIARSR